MWVVVFEPRPADRLLLHQTDGELDVHRRLEAGADDFPFALPRVAVAEEQQRAGLVDTGSISFAPAPIDA